MKLSRAQQDAIDRIRRCPGTKNVPERTRHSLLRAKLIKYVGIGKDYVGKYLNGETYRSFEGGCGFILADDFDATKHTELVLERGTACLDSLTSLRP